MLINTTLSVISVVNDNGEIVNIEPNLRYKLEIKKYDEDENLNINLGMLVVKRGWYEIEPLYHSNGEFSDLPKDTILLTTPIIATELYGQYRGWTACGYNDYKQKYLNNKDIYIGVYDNNKIIVYF